MNWIEVKTLAIKLANRLGTEYTKKLEFEIKEIEKQGAEDYWINILESGEKFTHNKNGLIFPFLFKVVDIDPIKDKIDHIIEYQPDFPDIDIDFLPIARDPIKEYASQKYGDDKVCSIGSWQRYGPKLALQDAARALDHDVDEIKNITTDLPDEFDKLSLVEAIKEHPTFAEYAKNNVEVVKMAYRMNGLIKTQGKHAGGLIISSVPINEHVPMTICPPTKALGAGGHWTSAWTEGGNTQLSKFGFIKFDILGLNTLLDIWKCCNIIKKNLGIQIVWDNINPEQNSAGYVIYADGTKEKIKLNDEEALREAAELRTDSIFQFFSPFAKSILQKGGVKSFDDLVIYTSLGRPGPSQMIEPYIKRRDGHEDWRSGENSDVIDILSETHGIIVFQEQLAKMWQKFAGFTAPESEAARKAVAKKWKDKLEGIEDKWIKGATKTLGEETAKEWWTKMVTFGSYAFNASHAKAYTIIAYQCLWLQAHYRSYWWASCMSNADPKKLVRFMGAARTSGVKFGVLNCNNLTEDFAVVDNKIVPGLLSVKGIGASVMTELEFSNDYKRIEDFVDFCTSKRVVCERLIKLGAFDKLHNNRRALWVWWLYNFDNSKYGTALRRIIKSIWCMDESAIKEIRKQKAKEYFKQYPNRKKIPKQIQNWVPTKPINTPNLSTMSKLIKFGNKLRTPSDEKFFIYLCMHYDTLELKGEADKIWSLSKKIELSRNHIEQLIDKDFALNEILEIEKEYLGYYWHSPLDVYDHTGNTSIGGAKNSGYLEAIIDKVEYCQGPKTTYVRLTVSDGLETARLLVWQNTADSNQKALRKGNAIGMRVSWSDKYRSFNIKGKNIQILRKKRDAVAV